MSYPSDLSDGQWSKLAEFFERPDMRGAREKHAKRRGVAACFYRLREGCRWCALPHNSLGWSTVANHFWHWRKRGVWALAVQVLNTHWREQSLGRGRRSPRHAILDSQSVKTGAEGEARGLHGARRSRAARATWPWTAKARSWPSASRRPTRATPRKRGAVVAQAKDACLNLESFTGDQGFRRRARAAAHALECELHVTGGPKKGFALIAFRWRVERISA